MKLYHYTFRLFVIILCLFIISCENTNTDKNAAQTNLANDQSNKIKQLQRKYIELSKQQPDLKKDYQKLEFEHENLLIQKKDLEAWANNLVESYGPSIWYFGVYEKPIFYKHSKGNTIQDIISELNTLLKKDGIPTVILDKIDKNVAYVRISDDEYLTQRMGSSGANSYLKVVTYSLASLKNIDCVYFDFDTGAHAEPGKYCKY
ncbi:MAG: hypothetical protein QNK40_10640 [Desulfobacterales bacterium]|nr:hypothetical protein [Desulfobacterales bacterium]